MIISDEFLSFKIFKRDLENEMKIYIYMNKNIYDIRIRYSYIWIYTNKNIYMKIFQIDI